MANSFDIQIPSADADTLSDATLNAGEALFVLGSNGTGKSSLMLLFASRNSGRSRRISAHRQTWMNTDTLDMTPASKVQFEQQMRHTDLDTQSRYRDDYAAQRASMTIYELLDAENVRARGIAAHVDARNMEAAAGAARRESPITVINELLLQSNIPITVSIRENERLMASKSGGPEYSAAELSDGERNALLIAGNVLTAPPGTLLIIDEPERHLHRSIISPLLSQLFERRSDCAFVISTHDHDLPLAMPASRVILLRSCKFDGSQVVSWEADELAPDALIDDRLKRDLVGARRQIVFVEGTGSSMDGAMYNLIFPMASVIPKGSYQDVQRAVSGLRAAEGFHWVRAFGIIDGDGRLRDDTQSTYATSVYALALYSVEAIYYHPRIINGIARRQARVTGDNAMELTRAALSAGIDGVARDTDRLSRKVAKKLARRRIVEQIPNDNELLAGQPLTLRNDARAILAARKRELDDAVKNNDWEALLRMCPVRESSALNNISTTLGFRRRQQYEMAVRHLLAQDSDSRRFVRSLFGDLFERLTTG